MNLNTRERLVYVFYSDEQLEHVSIHKDYTEIYCFNNKLNYNHVIYMDKSEEKKYFQNIICLNENEYALVIFKRLENKNIRMTLYSLRETTIKTKVSSEESSNSSEKNIFVNVQNNESFELPAVEPDVIEIRDNKSKRVKGKPSRRKKR